MKRASKPYIGITLTFCSRIERRLEIGDVSFLIRASSFEDIIRSAKKIGDNRSSGDISSHGEFVKYLGLNDVFGIVGPIGHGAMMGQTSKFSYKNIDRAKKMLGHFKDFTINQKGCDPAIDNLYIARFIYFSGKPVPYKSRRTLVCWGIVKSSTKNKIVEKATRLAQSFDFKRKITLRDCEKEFTSDSLQFVGIANIIPIFEKLKENNCFLYGATKIKNMRDIAKVKLPDPKMFKDFFGLFKHFFKVRNKKF